MGTHYYPRRHDMLGQLAKYTRIGTPLLPMLPRFCRFARPIRSVQLHGRQYLQVYGLLYYLVSGQCP